MSTVRTVKTMGIEARECALPLFDKYCKEQITFAISPELKKQLDTIPESAYVSQMKAIGFEETDKPLEVKETDVHHFVKLFKWLCSMSVNTADLKSVKDGLTAEQQAAIEQCKLNMMTVVYEDLLQKTKNQEDLEIPKKLQEQLDREQREEEQENVWWKKLISHAGFWFYFIYNVIGEFLGFACMMIEILGLPVKLSVLANPFVLVFAIPMTLLAAGAYLAFEGTMFGFTIAEHEKNRLKLMNEAIDINSKINSYLSDPDATKNFSSDTYRSFAYLSICFNNSIIDRKKAFQPVENVARKRLYWAACILGALTTLGGGYYAGVTFLAAFAALGLVAPPLVAPIVIGLIMGSLLVSFVFMQSTGIKEILLPTEDLERKVKDKLDVAQVKDQSSYLEKIRDRTLSDHASMQHSSVSAPGRLIEHGFHDAAGHQKSRPRSYSLTFAPGIFSEEAMNKHQEKQAEELPKKNTGF